jgi:hypothetical protein
MPELVTRPCQHSAQRDRALRYLMAEGVGARPAHGDRGRPALERHTPQVPACLEAELHTQAATAPGMINDATWAGPLARFGIATEALTLLRDVSILGRLEGAAAARAVPRRRCRGRLAAGRAPPRWARNHVTPVTATCYDEVLQTSIRPGRSSC